MGLYTAANAPNYSSFVNQTASYHVSVSDNLILLYQETRKSDHDSKMIWHVSRHGSRIFHACSVITITLFNSGCIYHFKQHNECMRYDNDICRDYLRSVEDLISYVGTDISV